MGRIIVSEFDRIQFSLEETGGIATGLVISHEGGGTARAEFDSGPKIPGELVKDGRLLTFAELNSHAQGLLRGLDAELRQRPVTFQGKAFFGAKTALGTDINASGGGFVRLHLAPLLGIDGNSVEDDEVIATVGFVSTVSAELEPGQTGLKASVAWVAEIPWKSIPRLRLEMPELGLKLPDFGFGKLDLSALTPTTEWRTPEWLRSLESPITVTGEVKPQIGYDSGTGVLSLEIPETTITVLLAGKPLFKVEKFSYASANNHLTGHVVREDTVKLENGEKILASALVVRWEGVKLDTRILQEIGAPVQLELFVSFERLMLFPKDDPASVIAVRGEIRVTPRAAIEELELVEPYPVKLVAQAVGAIGSAARDLLRWIVSLDPEAPGLPTPSIKPLLELLARIAAALARTTGQLLVGIARLIGELIAALAGAIQEAGRHLIVEVRLDAETFALRQLLITPAGDKSKPDSIEILGLQLAFKDAWQPGLLIDFQSRRGTYLIAVRNPDGGNGVGEIGTLSSDLWLQRESKQEAIRDSEPAEGKRSPDPVLSITPESKVELDAIALAGIASGAPVFFQRVVGSRAQAVPVAGKNVLAFGEGFGLEPLTPEDFDVTVVFQAERVLPFLQKSDNGAAGAGAGDFLKSLKEGIGQVVEIGEWKGEPGLENGHFKGELTLQLTVGGLETAANVKIDLDLETLSINLDAGDKFVIRGGHTEKRAMGLTWIVDPQLQKPGDATGPLYELDLSSGDGRFALAEGAKMEVRYADVSSDGRGLVFRVDKSGFAVSRAGLDLRARVAPEPVRLNGLDVPFQFTDGRISIRSSELEGASVTGTGRLPTELVGEAQATVMMKFGSENGRIVLEAAKAELDKSGEPIVCSSTRFVLTITHLGFDFVRDAGYHFYFLLTGSAEFRPNPGEFDDGLLKHLPKVRIELDEVPLTGDLRTLARHISFQVPISPKKRFTLFDVFSMELRGIGFYPASPSFDGEPPSLKISGQVAFADVGDVISTKIDFHGLEIAPPAKKDSRPRVRCEGLGVDLGLSGTARIRGAVTAVDGRMPTLEPGIVPDGYGKAFGFLGEGQLSVSGFADMSASIGFLELERTDPPRERERAFFLYLQRNQLSYEVPTPIVPIFLREVGFGFGYRYTLAGIKAAEQARSVRELIVSLDDISKRQGELASYQAWSPDLEERGQSPRITLALRGAFSLTTASSGEKYNESAEKELMNPFLFDIVLALRSDLTFLMNLRGWLSVNYHDFLTDETEKIRRDPLFRGYMYLSVPRSEFLGRFLSEGTGYIGNHPKLPDPFVAALRATKWSSTLYIRPGLFHFELGWPDQLRWSMKKGPFVLSCWGGFVFRVADDAILQGVNFGARLQAQIGGRVGGRSLGASVSASIDAQVAARFIAYLSTRISETLFYALVKIDVTVRFSVSAWLEIDLKFKSFKIRIGFSFALHVYVAAEVAVGGIGLGARAECRIGVRVFGRTLSLRVGLAVNDQKLDEARARVARFMSLGLTASTPDPKRAIETRTGDEEIETNARQARRREPVPEEENQAETPRRGEVSSDDTRYETGLPARRDLIGKTDFHAVLRVGPPHHYWVLLIPKACENAADQDIEFFASPPISSGKADYTLRSMDPSGVRWFNPEKRKLEPLEATPVSVKVGWDQNIEGIVLRKFFAECFHYSATIKDFKTDPTLEIEEYFEPPLRPIELMRVPGETEEDRLRELRHRQSERETSITASDAAVHDTRSIVFARALDDLSKLKPGFEELDADAPYHVGDLGLLFLVHEDQLAKSSSGTVPFEELEIDRLDVKSGSGTGKCTVFNPPGSHFENTRPTLEDRRSKIEADGIRLGWTLSAPESHGSPADKDIDHALAHYEIERTVEGGGRRVITFKNSDALGAKVTGGSGNDRNVQDVLCLSEWQFTDDLADLSPRQRRAYLKPTDPEDSVEALAAWINVAGDDDFRQVAYTITPVDIAGTRGRPRSMMVEIPRPTPPIRAAQAELLFEFDQVPGEHRTGNPEVDCRPFIRIEDTHWSRGGPSNGDESLVRSYRLVIQREATVPAGSYGSEGLTERLRKTTPEELAGDFAGDEGVNEKVFEFPREAYQPSTGTKPRYGNEETDSKFVSLMQLVAQDKRPELIQALRRSAAGGRAACRFYLETVVTVRSPNGKDRQLFSRRTPVSFEMRLRERAHDPVTAQSTAYTTQPEWFEWPEAVALPPIGDEHVAATTGLAEVRMPAEGQSLDAFLKDTATATGVVRDPERRTATRLTWEALPAPETEPIRDLYAGYDVAELDLDDVPSAEWVSGSPGPAAWKRAGTVARVQLLPRSVAELEPADTADLRGWEAFYPSDHYRAAGTSGRSGVTERGGSQAALNRWFTTRESTVEWPAWTIRRRLLPDPEEELITKLFERGIPDAIEFEVRLGDESLESPAAWSAEVSTEPLVSSVRRHLANLVWKGPADWEEALQGGTATARNEVMDRLNELVLRATVVFRDERAAKVGEQNPPRPTFTVDQPLRFGTAIHPFLEEVLADLRFPDPKPGEVFHRRYVPTTHAAPAIEAQNLHAAFVETAPDGDPYGWGILQRMGLAAAARLYDVDEERFVPSRDLLERVNTALERLAPRYSGSPLPRPNVEIMLRPGRGIALGAYDRAGASDDRFDIRDDGLAFVQLSIRPRRISPWRYSKLTLRWSESDGKILASPDATIGMRVLGQTTGPIDLLALEGGGSRRLEGAASAEVYFVPGSLVGQPDRPVTVLLARRRNDEAPSIEFFDATPELEGPDGKPTTNPPFHEPVPEWIEIDFDGSRSTDAELDPRETFEELSATDWVQALDDNKPAAQTFLWLASKLLKPEKRDDLGEWQTEVGLVKDYLPWMRRFLAHAPIGDAGQTEFAIASPRQQNPWKLASRADGTVDLVLLHQDRWAHTRAYSVRPFARYDALLGAANFDLKAVEQPFDREWPHAVAVVHRTERVSAPVIVGSLRDDPASGVPGEVWELLLASHTEQQIAASNRSAHARLAWEGQRLAFAREYLHPDWPERVFGDLPGPPPVPDVDWVYPVLPPEIKPKPVAPQAIDDTLLGEISRRHPAIWRGAEILRIERLPYFYKTRVLAHAAAGIAVSPVSEVTQRDFHYVLTSEFGEGTWRPRWKIEARAEGYVTLRLNMPLQRYRDLLDDGTREAWIRGASVADLPDPEVGYALLLQSAPAGESTVDAGMTIEEAELEVSSVREAVEGNPAYFGFSRGTRLTLDNGKGPLKLTRVVESNDVRWRLEVDLRRDWKKSNPPDPEVGLLAPEDPPAPLKSLFDAVGQPAYEGRELSVWARVAPQVKGRLVVKRPPGDEPDWAQLRAEIEAIRAPLLPAAVHSSRALFVVERLAPYAGVASDAEWASAGGPLDEEFEDWMPARQGGALASVAPQGAAELIAKFRRPVPLAERVTLRALFAGAGEGENVAGARLLRRLATTSFEALEFRQAAGNDGFPVFRDSVTEPGMRAILADSSRRDALIKAVDVDWLSFVSDREVTIDGPAGRPPGEYRELLAATVAAHEAEDARAAEIVALLRRLEEIAASDNLEDIFGEDLNEAKRIVCSLPMGFTLDTWPVRVAVPDSSPLVSLRTLPTRVEQAALEKRLVDELGSDGETARAWLRALVESVLFENAKPVWRALRGTANPVEVPVEPDHA